MYAANFHGQIAARAIDIAELLAIEEFGWCDREDLNLHRIASGRT